jgi:hypothetical protein
MVPREFVPMWFYGFAIGGGGLGLRTPKGARTYAPTHAAFRGAEDSRGGNPTPRRRRRRDVVRRTSVI